jgi:hypothetical protein
MTQSAAISDTRHYAALVGKLGPMKHAPAVPAARLRDVSRLVANLPSLSFPIDSAGELAARLGGENRTVDVFGVPMRLKTLLRGMPAHYFPIASAENFVEKCASLLTRSRRTVNLTRELGRIRPHLPKLTFPIASVEALLTAFEGVKSLPATSPNLPAGHRPSVDASQIRTWLVSNMTPDVFPIRSEEEMWFKALRLVPQGRHPKKS